MPSHRLDELAKDLGSTTSRRSALRVLAGTAGGGLLALFGSRTVPKASADSCKEAGRTCHGDDDGSCCGRMICDHGHCACPAGQRLQDGDCVCVSNGFPPCDGSCCAAGQTCVKASEDRKHCSSPCPPGELVCGSLCINAATDNANCGRCGNVCANGTSCVNGTCTCPGALPDTCSGQCVNKQTDLKNCGACGNACPAGESCTAGTCGCPSGKFCNGVCTNTATDNANCGACGTVCSGGMVCSGGVCACPAAYSTACNGLCVNTRSDNANCGGCGTLCPPGQICVAGHCATTCQQGEVICGGQCVTLTTDNTNCGACGTICPSGKTCISGQCKVACPPGQTPCPPANPTMCASVQSDNANCGACGNVCGAMQSCVGGTCSNICCGSGQTNCSGTCINTASDPNNCGACGRVCPSGQPCVGGACSCVDDHTACAGKQCGSVINNCGQNVSCGQCSAGTSCSNFVCVTVSCTNMIQDGQETDVDCGGPICPKCANGLKCQAASDCVSGVCMNGVCQTATCNDGVKNGGETDVDCGGPTACPRCINGKNCAQGSDCQSGVCSGGLCAQCSAGQTLCGSMCINTSSDPNNCGGCGIICLGANATMTCVGGTCQVGMCAAGFADCDRMAANGCEVNLNTDVNNCGGCGRACPSGPHSTVACSGGTCHLTCAPGFFDCNNNPTDGCEVSILNDANNCGMCGRKCPIATPTCSNGTCV